MQITLYKNFSKRKNSTKQPTGGTNVDVKLKQSTSRENPIFIIDGIDFDYNYAKWGDHYYYINDMVLLTNNIYELHCVQDVLATYKSNILSTTAFIEYSTGLYNANILDSRISNDTVITRSSRSYTNLSTFLSQTGSYILSVVSSDGVAVRYRCGRTILNNLGHFISTYNDSTLLDVFVQKYGSLYGCILGCTWVPYEPVGVAKNIYLGNVDTGVSAWEITSIHCVNISGISISIPWINTSAGNTPRQLNERMELYLPFYGTARLDASKFKGLSSINLNVDMDITGSVTYSLVHNDGTVEYFNANCGASIPITQFVSGPLGFMLGVSGKGYEAMSSDLATQPLSQITSKVYGHIGNIFGKLGNLGSNASSTGGQGGASLGWIGALNPNIVLTNSSLSYTESQPDMASKYGRPYMAVASLSALTGYVQCNGASVDISGLAGDKDEVNTYVNSGIYIE